MGVFDKLLGKGPKLEALDPSSAAAREVDSHRAQIEALGQAARDRLEAVPGDDGVFVFVGHPPKAFGLVWYRDGQEHNFKKLVEESGVSYARVQALVERLREVYSETMDIPKYEYQVGSQKLVVTPSETLERKIEEAIAAATA